MDYNKAIRTDGNAAKKNEPRSLKLRLAKARSLMKNEPRLKVYEIADRSGFADYKYFYRVFSAMYGVSPLKYKHEAYGAEGENGRE